MSGTPDTLQLIAQTLAARHGQVYAERWLESQGKQRQALPTLQRASELSKTPSLPPPERLSAPIKLLPEVGAPLTVISPEQAREEALRRFQGHCEVRAAKLRARVGFEKLTLRRDRQARLERFHSELVQLALIVAVKRSYKGACSVTLHTVMELVGYCLGIKSSSTLYSYLHALKGLGLLDFRGHVTTLMLPGEDGKAREVNRCDGALLCIRLGGCKRAQLSPYDYQETPRDLQTDISRGHTAFKLIRKLEESLNPRADRQRLTTLVLWSLNPKSLFAKPLESDPSGFSALISNGYPTEVLDVPNSKNRNQAVDVAARALARALGDTRSLNLYRKLLWQLLRAHDRGWDFFGVLYNETVRVLADKREGYARKSGALLVSRLKKSGCWEELWRDQGQWVGRPVVA